ncbi:MAG TPA: FmdB family zinc ribbon protein [Solirubrobacterales bacterium]|nr:FmdB family zinc ribbon protein [Solirubrobacterales bacterium]
MPIYDYKCDKGHRFEAMQSMSDAPIDTCDVCGAPAHRILHAPAVHFKGSGFYTTDYARKGKAQAANGSESGKSESKDGTGSKDGGSPSKSESGSSSSTSSGGGETAAAKKD